MANPNSCPEPGVVFGQPKGHRHIKVMHVSWRCLTYSIMTPDGESLGCVDEPRSDWNARLTPDGALLCPACDGTFIKCVMCDGVGTLVVLDQDA